jgi:hypothetical protein
VIRRRYRGRAARLAGIVLLVLAAGLGPARAEGEICRMGSQEYQPDATVCSKGITYTCQDNGAWLSDRSKKCIDPMYASTSCHLTANRSAAEGTRACIRGKRSQCDGGHWVDLHKSC